MLFPHLVQLNRNAFVFDEALESTVRLDEHRGASELAELDLGDEDVGAAQGVHMTASRFPIGAGGAARP